MRQDVKADERERNSMIKEILAEDRLAREKVSELRRKQHKDAILSQEPVRAKQQRARLHVINDI